MMRILAVLAGALFVVCAWQLAGPFGLVVAFLVLYVASE